MLIDELVSLVEQVVLLTELVQRAEVDREAAEVVRVALQYLAARRQRRAEVVAIVLHFRSVRQQVQVAGEVVAALQRVEVRDRGTRLGGIVRHHGAARARVAACSAPIG